MYLVAMTRLEHSLICPPFQIGLDSSHPQYHPNFSTTRSDWVKGLLSFPNNFCYPHKIHTAASTVTSSQIYLDMQQKKYLRFGEPLTYENPSRASLSAADKETMYYSGDDLRDIRDAASALVQRVRKNKDLENQASYTSVVRRIYETCLQQSVPNSADIKLLVHWDKHRPSRRGLDPYCVSTVSSSRRKRRSQAMKAVIAAQEESKDISPDARAEILRTVSEKRSKASKVYARVLGITDAAVSKEIDQTKPKRPFEVLDGVEDYRPSKKLCHSQPMAPRFGFAFLKF